MKTNKNIELYNDKNEEHGYWEVHLKHRLVYKCFYINGTESGYEEYYSSNGTIQITFHL